MLHLSYQPFVNQSVIQSASWPDLESLLNNVSVAAWSRKLPKRQHCFYFKLKDFSVARRPVQASRRKSHEEVEEEAEGERDRLLEELDDIEYNEEEGCRILKVMY